MTDSNEEIQKLKEELKLQKQLNDLAAIGVKGVLDQIKELREALSDCLAYISELDPGVEIEPKFQLYEKLAHGEEAKKSEES